MLGPCPAASPTLCSKGTSQCSVHGEMHVLRPMGAAQLPALSPSAGKGSLGVPHATSQSQIKLLIALLHGQILASRRGRGAFLGLLARAILTPSTCMPSRRWKSEKPVQRKSTGFCLLPAHSYCCENFLIQY